MKKLKKPGWWDEFTAFAIKGNAMALAVGTIIGAAFSTITKSLTDDVIMPIVSIFLGGIDFSEMKLTLPRLFAEKYDEAGNVIENTLNYGNFISAVINFFILAIVVFVIVKGLNKLSELGKKKEEEAAAAEPPAPPAPSAEEVLLTEIRDLLKDKN
ncbi:MAG: large-conductance mechanosensitive channel protein MscL [Oscillospiraceae bacterium]|nr:large-conductance mechanosensitive channel protein MscL [Oscillospiraceae bacterium]